MKPNISLVCCIEHPVNEAFSAVGYVRVGPFAIP